MWIDDGKTSLIAGDCLRAVSNMGLDDWRYFENRCKDLETTIHEMIWNMDTDLELFNIQDDLIAQLHDWVLEKTITFFENMDQNEIDSLTLNRFYVYRNFSDSEFRYEVDKISDEELKRIINFMRKYEHKVFVAFFLTDFDWVD